MSAQNPSWRMLPGVHINRLNPLTGKAESGWELSIQDNVVQNVIPLFVPDDQYNTERVLVMAEDAVQKNRDIHSLQG